MQCTVAHVQPVVGIACVTTHRADAAKRHAPAVLRVVECLAVA